MGEADEVFEIGPFHRFRHATKNPHIFPLRSVEAIIGRLEWVLEMNECGATGDGPYALFAPFLRQKTLRG